MKRGRSRDPLEISVPIIRRLHVSLPKGIPSSYTVGRGQFPDQRFPSPNVLRGKLLQVLKVARLHGFAVTDRRLPSEIRVSVRYNSIVYKSYPV